MYSSIVPILGWLVLVTALALAWWRGGAAERFGALAVVMGAVVGLGIERVLPSDIQPMMLLAADALLAGALLLLAVRYASLWLGMAMIFQAGQFVLHAVYTAGELEHDRRYAVINNVVTTAIVVMVLSGVLATWRKRVVTSRVTAA